ncbi:MAG: ABC transporter substrate-binding protein [Actinomycetota bacterium]
MKGIIRFVAIAVTVAFAAAACSSDDEPAAGGGADGKAQLVFWDNQQSESGLSEFQQTAVEEFEAANPDIDVKVETIPYDQYQQRLQLAVEGGDPPDISTVDQIWNPAFGAGGAVVALDDYIAGSDSVSEDNFFPGAWDSALYEDQVFGIPFNVDVWQFTYYNQQLLNDAGVDPQSLTTWDGLMDAAQRMTKGDQFGVGLFGQQYESIVVVVDSFIYSNGGSVLNEDGSCALDEPEAVEALTYLQDLQQYAPPGILNSTNEDMRELFLNGSLGLEWWPALEQPTLQDSQLNWGFVAGTAPDGGEPVGTYGGWNLVIYEDSPNKDAAWKFIEFLTDPEVNGRVVDLIPANTDAAEIFLQDNREKPDVIMEHLERARPRPLSPQYLELSTIQQQMTQTIFDGGSVEDATAQACSDIEALG